MGGYIVVVDQLGVISIVHLDFVKIKYRSFFAFGGSRLRRKAYCP